VVLAKRGGQRGHSLARRGLFPGGTVVSDGIDVIDGVEEDGMKGATLEDAVCLLIPAAG